MPRAKTAPAKPARTAARIGKALSAPDQAPKRTRQEPTFKPPTSLAACADLLYKLRAERYRLQAQAEAIKKQESVLSELFIQSLPKKDSTGIAGNVARVQLDEEVVVKVADWGKFYAQIIEEYASLRRKKGADPSTAFALLQRRVGDKAVKERWDAGVKVAGTERMRVPTVSCTKI